VHFVKRRNVDKKKPHVSNGILVPNIAEKQQFIVLTYQIKLVLGGDINIHLFGKYYTARLGVQTFRRWILTLKSRVQSRMELVVDK
jgi:hypothetical protein